MSTGNVELRVAGQWLSTIAEWSGLELQHNQHGPLEASWEMALRDEERPWVLTRNAVVSAFTGPNLVWSGTLTEPDWDGSSFTAIGIARAGEGAECLTSGGLVTSKPNTAIDQAIARGVVPWTRAFDFGNTDLAGPEGGTGISDPEPGKLNELLDQWAVEQSQQWRVSAAGAVFGYTPAEATPSWYVLPGSGTLGVSDDGVTDRVFLRYYSSTASQYRTASYPAVTPAGGVERRASIVHLGAMTPTRATAIAQGMWNRAQQGRTGWTNGIEVTAGQIITPGGLDADLSMIRGGDTVCLMDTSDPRSASRSLNFVIDNLSWDVDERTVQLNPVGLAARTWEQVMEEANARGDN